MSIRVVRNPKESVDRLISRFHKKVQASRIILLLKERRYLKHDPSPRHQRKAAIMRNHYRTQREKAKFY